MTSKTLEAAIRRDVRQALKALFDKFKALTISTNWEVHDKTYGEVGGRFLEDFLLTALKANLAVLHPFHIVGAEAPAGRRTMEDVIADWQTGRRPRQRLLISLKGHKAGSASNPNLVSLQKAKAFYAAHPANTHFLLVVLHYLPERIVHDGFTMTIQDIDVYHLKDLADQHLSLQTVGAGGQFLLSGIDKIRDSYRTPDEFYQFVCRKELERQTKRKR
jgi:hypothetical protein